VLSCYQGGHPIEEEAVAATLWLDGSALRLCREHAGVPACATDFFDRAQTPGAWLDPPDWRPATAAKAPPPRDMGHEPSHR